MGSALAVAAASHEANDVTLIGSPLDSEIVDSINRERWHPTLKVNITDRITCLAQQDLSASLMDGANIIVIGVSSPGVSWATAKINKFEARPDCIALVTKGLVATDADSPPLTYADALSDSIDSKLLLGIGGPCIARELALGMPTFVMFAARDTELATRVRGCFQTDAYRISVHPDFIGLEACAALKNFFCIGVSAMLGAWQIENQTAKNPVAALFNQAVVEMDLLSNWIRAATETPEERQRRAGRSHVAFDLPGMGDLHVTVGGGRNSRLGTLLGQGNRLSEIVAGPMQGITVEGLDTGRQLLPGLKAALDCGSLSRESIPLTLAILDSVQNDSPFVFDFQSYAVSA